MPLNERQAAAMQELYRRGELLRCFVEIRAGAFHVVASSGAVSSAT